MLIVSKVKQKVIIIGKILIECIFIKYPNIKTPKQKEIEPLILTLP